MIMVTSTEMYDTAIAMHERGQLDEAISKLKELLAHEETYALAHAALSVFYSRLERHDEAIEHAQRVCDLEPDDPFSFIAMSLLCQKAGRIPEAERALMEARRAQYSSADRQEPDESP